MKTKFQKRNTIINTVGKTTLLLSFTLLSVVGFGQHDHSSHQQQQTRQSTNTQPPVNDASGEQRLSQLLSLYFNIKNALVTGDAGSAASNADQFLRTANSIDYKVISEGNLHILSRDAGKISGTKDLKKQRSYFVNLSSNMASVARAIKLSTRPIYLQHCPMNKASWLSSEKQIKNPYYGSTMLTCGQVTETL